jgi:hypothetical protein
VSVEAGGGAAERRERAGRTALVATLLFVAATAATWLRIPPTARDTLYAEDGSHFVNDWVNDDSLGTLFNPYAGYQHLVPRAGTGLVTHVVPVADWAVAVNFMACIVVGAIAVLVYLASASLLDSALARLGLSAVVVLVPLAVEEAIGNLANVHWYFFFLVPFVLLARPEGLRRQIGWAAVALVSTLTEPQCIVFAPLAVWLVVRDRRCRLVVAGYALGLAVQAVSYLSAPRPRSDGLPPLLATVKGYLVNAVFGAINAHGRVVGAVVERTGWVGPGLALVAFLAVGVVAYRYGGRWVRLATVVLIVGSVLAWAGPYLFNNESYLYYDAPPDAHGLPLIRWGMTASMFLLALVPLASDGLLRLGRTGRGLALAGLVGLVAMMTLSFSIANDGRTSPPWHSEVDRGRQVCLDGATQVALATAPSGYFVAMPCDRLAR